MTTTKNQKIKEESAVEANEIKSKKSPAKKKVSEKVLTEAVKKKQTKDSSENPVVKKSTKIEEELSNRPKLSGASFLGRGKRKRSTAVAVLYIGDSNKDYFDINGHDIADYFKQKVHHDNCLLPMSVVRNLGADQNFNFLIKVHGGGSSSQSDAVRLAIAKSLGSFSKEFRFAMRQSGFLTTDSRIVQPKKSGYKKARKKEQFSKR